MKVYKSTVLRPLLLPLVAISAITVSTCRSSRNLEKPEVENPEPPVASLDSGVNLVSPVIPSIVLLHETATSEELNSVEAPIQEIPLQEEVKSEPTTGAPVISVTVDELKSFQEAMNILENYSARAVLDGKKVIFPNPKGFTKEDAVHIKERKFGLPPNGKLVSANSGTDTKAKKKSISFTSVLSDVGKAVSHPELTIEEENALRIIIEFLEKNGPFNYDSIDLIMERVTASDQETQEKVRKELIEGLQRLGVKEPNK